MSELDRFWAKSLGCREQDLNFNESKIVVRTEETDYNKNRAQKEIDIFQRKENTILSCSKEAENKLRKHEAELLDSSLAEEEIEKNGLKIKEMLGPAFLSYTKEEKFNKTESKNCRRLGQKDIEDLEELKHQADTKEIENSIGDSEIGEGPVFGKFADDNLVAVSSYSVWDQTIGFSNVFVKEEYRGKGYGKQVVSKSTKHILENNLIPVYRTLEKWSSSVRLAKSLGYTKYATTYLIKLKKL